jgi:predicted acetyltransferase
MAEFQAEGRGGPPRRGGRVPQTTLWWVSGDEYLGRISIRHRLTAHLREIGGHIGYDIRLSARQHGHATAMLAANGGTLEDHRHGKARYWVSTS